MRAAAAGVSPCKAQGPAPVPLGAVQAQRSALPIPGRAPQRARAVTLVTPAVMGRRVALEAARAQAAVAVLAVLEDLALAAARAWQAAAEVLASAKAGQASPEEAAGPAVRGLVKAEPVSQAASGRAAPASQAMVAASVPAEQASRLRRSESDRLTDSAA